MKPAFVALCLLGTTLAFGQNAPSPRNDPQPYEPPSHPQHAAPHALAAERYILAGGTYLWEQGQRKPSDLPHAAPANPPAAQSLGEAARMLKSEHLNSAKARIVLED